MAPAPQPVPPPHTGHPGSPRRSPERGAAASERARGWPRWGHPRVASSPGFGWVLGWGSPGTPGVPRIGCSGQAPAAGARGSRRVFVPGDRVAAGTRATRPQRGNVAAWVEGPSVLPRSGCRHSRGGTLHQGGGTSPATAPPAQHPPNPGPPRAGSGCGRRGRTTVSPGAGRAAGAQGLAGPRAACGAGAVRGVCRCRVRCWRSGLPAASGTVRCSWPRRAGECPACRGAAVEAAGAWVRGHPCLPPTFPLTLSHPWGPRARLGTEGAAGTPAPRRGGDRRPAVR